MEVASNRILGSARLLSVVFFRQSGHGIEGPGMVGKGVQHIGQVSANRPSTSMLQGFHCRGEMANFHQIQDTSLIIRIVVIQWKIARCGLDGGGAAQVRKPTMIPKFMAVHPA